MCFWLPLMMRGSGDAMCLQKGQMHVDDMRVTANSPNPKPKSLDLKP